MISGGSRSYFGRQGYPWQRGTAASNVKSVRRDTIGQSVAQSYRPMTCQQPAPASLAPTPWRTWAPIQPTPTQHTHPLPAAQTHRPSASKAAPRLASRAPVSTYRHPSQVLEAGRLSLSFFSCPKLSLVSLVVRRARWSASAPYVRLVSIGRVPRPSCALVTRAAPALQLPSARSKAESLFRASSTLPT